MKVANGVETFELTMNVMGTQSVIHPTLIWDTDTVILVDTGIPRQLEAISEAMEKLGVPFSRLSKIIITHQDVDHIGSLKEILRASNNKIEVIAHVAEKPYIEGEKPIIKMSPEVISKLFKGLPEEQRKQAGVKFLDSLKSKIDRTVVDGEIIPCCGGITVIFTPGHTPGHICLYLNESKILIAGDMLNFENGQLIGSHPEHAFDKSAALESLKKFTQFDIEKVICYHGGLVKDNINQRIAELATL